MPSPRRNSTTSKSARLATTDWPEPDYQPEALPSPEQDFPALQHEGANSEFVGSDGLRGEEEESPAQAICNRKLARVFEERPEVRKKLMDLLADVHSQDDEALKLQVAPVYLVTRRPLSLNCNTQMHMRTKDRLH